MKKKVRSTLAISGTTLHQCLRGFSWTSRVVLCALGLSAAAQMDAVGTHAQDARPPSLPSWAVQVSSDSRCAADSDFAAQLGEPIPGPQRATAQEAELLATVSVHREGTTQLASVQVFDRILQSQAGARELSLPMASCRETAEALSLVISVLVEAGRTPQFTEPAPLVPPPPPPPPEPEARPPEPVNEKPSARVPKRYAWLGPKAGHDLTAQAGIGWGLLPSTYYGGTVGWGIRTAKLWPIWLSATGWLPQTSDDGRGEFSAFYGSVSVCPLTGQRGRLRGQLCPSFAGGVLKASGKGLATNEEQHAPLLLLGLEMKSDFRIAGPLALAVTGRAEAPLTHPKFAYDRLGGSRAEIFEPAPVNLTLTFGLSLIFR